MSEIDTRKRELRRARWKALRAEKAARFPGAVGRIPNFTGAEAAAERLAREAVWEKARVILCNPDLAQRPVRYRALRQGKTVCMAVPRLAREEPFVELDPREFEERELWNASSIGGAIEHGRPVTPRYVAPPSGRRRRRNAMRAVDLVVIGAVAVAPDGARLGKGGGFSDLEYALLRTRKIVGPRTPVVSTVHPTQVLRRGTIPMEAHDVPLDLYTTPKRRVQCARVYRRPGKVRLELLDAAKRAAIPVLARAP